MNRSVWTILFSTGLLLASISSAQAAKSLPPSATSVASAVPVGNSTLRGTYVFLLRGFIGGLNANSAGTFTADGNGHILGGSVDSTGVGATTTLPFTGTYTATSPNQFSLTLGVAGVPINIPLFLGALNGSSVAVELRTELGTGAVAESGVFYLQDSALSTQNPLQAGSFIFGVSGAGASSRTIAAGRFDATAAGAISNGELDAFNQTGSAPVQALNAVPFTGTLSPQPGQHLAATFNLSGLSSQFNVYPVSNDQFLMLEVDTPAGGLPPSSGVAFRQIGSTTPIEPEARRASASPASSDYGFTDSSLKGTSVFSLSGVAGSSGSLAAVGLFGFDGSGSFTINAVQEVAGKTGSTTQGAASYSLADNGRLVLGAASAPEMLGYVTDTGRALLVSAGTSLSFGFFEPQTATDITTQTLGAGGYLFGSTSPASSQSPQDAGIATLDGDGNVTSYLVSDSNAGGVSGSAVATYTIDGTGLLTSSAGLTGYLVSATRFIALLPSSTFSVPVVFDQASSGPSTPTLTSTTTSLTTTSNSVMAGASITLTATVNPSVATGTVAFYDDNSSLGAAVPLNAGIALFPTSSLAVGTHNLTAVYSGDSTYSTSTSSSVQILVTPPDNSQVAGTSNPQVAAYTFTLQEPGTVTVDFGPTTSYGLETSAQHFAAGTPATIYVAGMLQSATYHMRSVIAYDNGTAATDPDHTFTTGVVPSGIIPEFTVTQTNGLTPQPGIELIDLLQGITIGAPSAIDLNGNVIWTYLFPDRQAGSILYPLKLQPNGHFIALIAEASPLPVTSGPVPASSLNVLREFDLAGNIIRQLSMAQLNAGLAANGFNLTLQVFSHDFAVLPNGHILVIANTLKTFTNLTGLPGNTTVLGDVVVDLDTNLNPVWVWNEFDHLDVNRHPYQFPDWTHSNAIAYSQDDGNFLISIRHQNWIVKVDYNNGAGAGDVIWKLGYQGDFALQGAVDPTDWFYAQHDVNFVSSNTTGNFQIAVMDNGDDRVFPAGVQCNSAGAPPCLYTTSQVLQVDENAKTASFLFHQILSPNLYNAFAGDNRVQPNGNVEYNLAGVGTDSYVFEVTPTANPQTVWQMHIVKTNTYRAFRIPSLYPGVQW